MCVCVFQPVGQIYVNMVDRIGVLCAQSSVPSSSRSSFHYFLEIITNHLPFKNGIVV